MFQKKQLRNGDEEGIQFMNYPKYKELIEKKFAAVLAKDDLYLIIEEDDIIKEIKIPEFLLKMSKETGEPLQDLVNYAIKYLIIDMECGNIKKTRSVLGCIKEYQGMPEDDKNKLLAYILKNMGETTNG